MPTVKLQRVAATTGDEARRPIAVRVRLGTEAEHLLLADAVASNLGNDLGPDPHDLYDAALAACKALTVLWYARKKGLPVTDLGVVLDSDRSRERAGHYDMHVRMEVGGPLTPAQVAELQAAADKCPVHRLMTQVETHITTELGAAPAP